MRPISGRRADDGRSTERHRGNKADRRQHGCNEKLHCSDLRPRVRRRSRQQAPFLSPAPACGDVARNVLAYSGDAREARHGHFQTSASRSYHRLPLVLGVGASRMCCCARLRVVRRTPARTGRRGWRTDGVAADDSPLGVRPPQRRWRSFALRRLGATRRAGHDLLADRNGKWMRPALEPLAMASPRHRDVHRRHRRPRPTGVKRLG